MKVRAHLWTGFAAAALLVLAVVPARADVKRVVSLNPCLDTLLIYVADREQIAALSHYARDPYGSNIPEIAATLPITYESAEEVIALQPDLVLTSRHSSLATRNALRRLKVQTELFEVPETVETSIAQIRLVAGFVGHPERGENIIAQIDAALEAAKPEPGARPISALIFQPNGFAPGSGTLANEMLERTGFVNVAGRYGLKKWGNVALEPLMADPPDVLLAGEVMPDMPTWAERVMSHPALKHGLGHMARASFPQRLLYCGGPVLIETAAALTRARALVRAKESELHP